MEADGAPFNPFLCQCSILLVFKAMATRIRGKSKHTLKLLNIEPETSDSESRALAKWATTALISPLSPYSYWLFTVHFFGLISSINFYIWIKLL